MAGRSYPSLAPIRDGTPAHQAHVADLSRRLKEIVARLDQLEGHQGQPTMRSHLDMRMNRVTNVGPTRSAHDAPSVGELQTHALYAGDGVHETDLLIHARGGVRTRAARAHDEAVTLGQVRDLIAAQTGTTQTTQAPAALTADATDFATASEVASLALTHPDVPANVTVVNGANPNLKIPNLTFIRLVGPTAAFSLGGFRPVHTGRLLIVYCTVAQTMTILNEDLNTTAAYRFTTHAGDLTMDGPGIQQFLYDGVTDRWVAL